MLSPLSHLPFSLAPTLIKVHNVLHLTKSNGHLFVFSCLNSQEYLAWLSLLFLKHFPPLRSGSPHSSGFLLSHGISLLSFFCKILLQYSGSKRWSSPGFGLQIVFSNLSTVSPWVHSNDFKYLTYALNSVESRLIYPTAFLIIPLEYLIHISEQNS